MIRTSFRKLALLYHPDIRKGNHAAEARFKEISAAYQRLKENGWHVAIRGTSAHGINSDQATEGGKVPPGVWWDGQPKHYPSSAEIEEVLSNASQDRIRRTVLRVLLVVALLLLTVLVFSRAEDLPARPWGPEDYARQNPSRGIYP